MGNYGNNVVALVTGGTLVYVDEPTSETIGDTEFDKKAIAGVDYFLVAFAVDGIYRPGILNRAIKAIVRYIQDDSQVQSGQRHKSPKITIKTPNDPSNGIKAEEFEAGQIVIVPPRKGADAVTKRLSRIVKQTAAFVTYELY